MKASDLIGYIGLIFIGVSLGFFLQLLYFWAIQHGDFGFAVASFVVGFVFLTIAGLIQAGTEPYEKRPKAINRK
jgi:hypothetical protein